MNCMNKRILILGGTGMIGHRMIIELKKSNFEIFTTITSKRLKSDLSKTISPDNIFFFDFNSRNFSEFLDLLNKIKPDFIINCVGITIRKIEIEKLQDIIFVNSLLPHLLANWVEVNDKKLIHFSTDCVFDGKSEIYFENSNPNETSLYGLTKGLGEVSNCQNVLTLRGSMIGRELFDKTELLEWFLKSSSDLTGFHKVYYSGITTLRMAKYISKIIRNNLPLSGLFNVSSIPISKYELLQIFKDVYKKNNIIHKDTTKKSKKILDSPRFFREINEPKPSWKESLIDDLINEKIYYETL